MLNIEKCLTINNKEVACGKNTPETIIVHHTGSGNATLRNILKFFRRIDYLSVHFIVGRGGEIIQYVDVKDVAYHVGVSKWNGLTNINYHSIGIEVVSDGYDYTNKQRDATIELCKELMKKHNIPKENVLRHADVAIPKGRKWDIGPNFFAPWGSWEGFQDILDPSSYGHEKESATEWIKKMGISNGQRPLDNITRIEVFVILNRFWKKIKE